LKCASGARDINGQGAAASERRR